MLSFTGSLKVFVAMEACDMRRGQGSNYPVNRKCPNVSDQARKNWIDNKLIIEEVK